MQKRFLAFAIAVLAIPALVVAQKVSYDYEKSANFAGFKTYAMKDGTKVGQAAHRRPHRRGHRCAACGEGPDQVRRES